MTSYRPLRPHIVHNIHYAVLQLRATIQWNIWTWCINHKLPWYWKDTFTGWLITTVLIGFLISMAFWSIYFMVNPL